MDVAESEVGRYDGEEAEGNQRQADHEKRVAYVALWLRALQQSAHGLPKQLQDVPILQRWSDVQIFLGKVEELGGDAAWIIAKALTFGIKAMAFALNADAGMRSRGEFCVLIAAKSTGLAVENTVKPTLPRNVKSSLRGITGLKRKVAALVAENRLNMVFIA